MLQKSILFCLIISEIAIKLTAQESKNIQPAALGIHVASMTLSILRTTTLIRVLVT